MAKKNSCPRVDIGGQAVLDGVMMKAPDAVAVAVRRPNGDIVVKREAYVSPAKKHKWMGWPFIRGAVSMVSMMGLGMRVLTESASMVGEETQEEPGKFEKWLTEKLGDKAEKSFMGLAVVMALALSIGLFVLLPNLAMFFFPKENLKRTFAVRMFEVICEKNGVEVLGWRKVPVHPEILGDPVHVTAYVRMLMDGLLSAAGEGCAPRRRGR